jgi:hypothetical protein
MDYGLAHGSQSNVYTLEKYFLQCVIMYLTFLSSWSDKIDFDSNYRICERWENFLNLDFHENKIIELDLWAFELVICTFAQCFYSIDTFSYGDVITTWILDFETLAFHGVIHENFLCPIPTNLDFVLKMLGMLGSYFSMYICFVGHCIEVQWIMLPIFPALTISIFLCMGFVIY